jgi:hypothetical protein
VDRYIALNDEAKAIIEMVCAAAWHLEGIRPDLSLQVLPIIHLHSHPGQRYRLGDSIRRDVRFV